MVNFPPTGTGQVRSFRMPADFWLRRAERCREQNQPLRAVTLLRHAARQEPGTPDLQLEYALLLHDLGCYEVSNRECFDLLARHPQCFLAFGLVARNMLALGQMGESMDAYGIYTQYTRAHPEELPEWDEDVYDVEDALMSMPQPRRRVRVNTLLKHAGFHIQRGRQQQAKALLDRVGSKSYAQRLPQMNALTALYHAKFGARQKAERYALLASLAAPRTPTLLVSMALMLYQLHSPSAGPTLLRAAVCARSAEDEQGVCVAASLMGCPGVAVAMLERTLKHMPYRMSALYDLCILRMRSHDFTGVSSSVHRLREIDPDDPAVERLFAIFTLLDQKPAAAEEIKAAAGVLPFYGMPDTYAAGQSLKACCDVLGDGVDALAQAIASDKRLCRHFTSLFAIEDNLYILLPALCAAMKPEEAAVLLRRLLLNGSLTGSALETVCALMGELGHKPPYLIRSAQRMTLVNPVDAVAPQPTLMQRLLYRRITAISRALGSHTAVPFVLSVIAAMKGKERASLAGDRYSVWLPAFQVAYARYRATPAPVLSGALTIPMRRHAFSKALHILARCLKEDNQHGTH